MTTDPVRPGFHYYELIVDGTHMPDPSSETFFGWAQQTSGLEVPDPAVDVLRNEANSAWRGCDVHLYRAATTGQFREAYIYTPPGYRHQHQIQVIPFSIYNMDPGENERGWTQSGQGEPHPRQSDRRKERPGR